MWRMRNQHQFQCVGIMSGCVCDDDTSIKTVHSLSFDCWHFQLERPSESQCGACWWHLKHNVSVLPVHAPTTSSHSGNSPLSPSITPSLFHSRLKTYLFHKPFPHRLPYSLRTDSTNFTTGPFLLSISVLCFYFLHYSVFVWFRAAD